MKLVFTDANGMVTGWMGCPAEHQAALVASHPEAFLVDDEVVIEPEVSYVEAEVVKQRPSSPSRHHTFDWTAKTWVFDTALAAAHHRAQRNTLLAQSDWTQLPDVPLGTKTAWATYRQALRDITEQENFPESVEWPTPPGEGD